MKKKPDLWFGHCSWKLRMECARLSPKAAGSEGGMDACGRVLGDEERAKESGNVRNSHHIGSSFFGWAWRVLNDESNIVQLNYGHFGTFYEVPIDIQGRVAEVGCFCTSPRWQRLPLEINRFGICVFCIFSVLYGFIWIYDNCISTQFSDQHTFCILSHLFANISIKCNSTLTEIKLDTQLQI